MDTPTFGFLLLAWSAAALFGLSKTGVPGVSLTAVLVMTLAFPGQEKLSVGVALPILVVGDVISVCYYGRHVDWSKLLGLFPAVALGMIPAYIVMDNIDNDTFRVILGVLVVLLLVLEIARRRFGWETIPHHPAFIFLMGLLAGFATLVGNAAGPVMSIYLLARGVDKTSFMGGWSWFFLIVNTTKIPLFVPLGIITWETLWLDLWILPAIGVGALIGRGIFLLIPQRVFDWLVLALATVAAIKMMTG